MSIKQERIDHFLDQYIEPIDAFPGQAWTRRDWLKRQHGNGCSVYETTIPKHQFDRRKYNRLNGVDQEEYEAKCKIMVAAYVLYGEEHGEEFSEFITKIEFDHFRSLGDPIPIDIPRVMDYLSVMEDPAIAEIVHQLQEMEDGDEWWALAEALRDICSRKQIDLIDSANNWNINE